MTQLPLSPVSATVDQQYRMKRLIQQLAWYYRVNDCADRHEDDALEVPLVDLREADSIASDLDLPEGPASAPSQGETHGLAQTPAVTDEMVERAWAGIVGRDIADVCHNASVVRGDIRAALVAALTDTSTDRHCEFCHVPMATVDCCDSEFESKGCPHMAIPSTDRTSDNG